MSCCCCHCRVEGSNGPECRNSCRSRNNRLAVGSSRVPPPELSREFVSTMCCVCVHFAEAASSASRQTCHGEQTFKVERWMHTTNTLAHKLPDKARSKAGYAVCYGSDGVMCFLRGSAQSLSVPWQYNRRSRSAAVSSSTPLPTE